MIQYQDIILSEWEFPQGLIATMGFMGIPKLWDKVWSADPVNVEYMHVT